MSKLFSPYLLRQLRNNIPIEKLISEILDIPWKKSEGYFRFLCPICNEFNTSTKKETNLARCFRCKKNFNTIDLVLATYRISFVDAANLLKHLLSHFNKLN